MRQGKKESNISSYCFSSKSPKICQICSSPLTLMHLKCGQLQDCVSFGIGTIEDIMFVRGAGAKPLQCSTRSTFVTSEVQQEKKSLVSVRANVRPNIYYLYYNLPIFEALFLTQLLPQLHQNLHNPVCVHVFVM